MEEQELRQRKGKNNPREENFPTAIHFSSILWNYYFSLNV